MGSWHFVSAPLTNSELISLSCCLEHRAFSAFTSWDEFPSLIRLCSPSILEEISIQEISDCEACIHGNRIPCFTAYSFCYNLFIYLACSFHVFPWFSLSQYQLFHWNSRHSHFSHPGMSSHP